MSPGMTASRLAAAARGPASDDAARALLLPEPVEDWLRQALHAADRGEAREVTLRLVADPARAGWLVRFDEPAADVDLPPRLRRLLERMLLGESEKEAAASLALSRHTVHEYVKQLYRRLGVASRAELMARFVATPSS